MSHIVNFSVEKSISDPSPIRGELMLAAERQIKMGFRFVLPAMVEALR
jgi:hypothetical protein